MLQGDFKLALVHDELVRRGGAEVVFEELLRMFPQADVYALYAGQTALKIAGQRREIHTSFLQKLPRWFRRHPGRVLPLLPQAAEQLDFSTYDLVISSASGFVKGIVTRAHVPHLCYCHTPTRYLWNESQAALARSPYGTQWLLRGMTHYLRLADFSAAQRVDHFLANSRYTQQRLMTFYRRESMVVYPPIATTFYTPGRATRATNSPFLVVSRLTPSKHVEQAIEACEKLRQPLIIIGQGREARRLQKMAGKETRFITSVSRKALRDYYRRARALLQPGIEDFGMATAEAQACGTPVIAYNVGGVREIVAHRVTGYLYTHQRVEALAEALRRCVTGEIFRAEDCQRQSLRFSTRNFQAGIRGAVEKILSS
ncbi:MAG: glycosyltransferase [Candidatus Andersenbacteria bacterium]